MTDYSDYGAILASGSVAAGTYVNVAGVIKIAPPAIKNEKVESTNHSSGGKKQFISSGLTEIADFKVNLSADKTILGNFATNVQSGSAYFYRITFPNSASWVFPSLLTALEQGEADAQNPKLMTADVTFSPSGSLVIS